MLNMRQAPNLITLSRIVMIIAIFWMVPFSSNISIIWAALLYTVAGASDYLDGWMARRFGLVSDLGKVLDPLADKILVLVFLPLLQMQVIHFFPVFIIVAREFAVMALRVLIAKSGHSVSANFSGKLKTAITLPVCGILFGRIAVETIHPIPAILLPIEWLRVWIFSWPNWVIQTLIWATVMVTLASFIDYLWRFFWQRTLEKANGNTNVAKRNLLVVIPNSITLVNLGCGIASIYFASTQRIGIASALVLLGIYFDAFDGRLARKLDVNSKFGANLDSKADWVSFGIAPGVILFMTLNHMPIVGAILGLCHYAAVHFRLRRFNKTGHSHYFDGLPSPTGAAVVIVAAASGYLHSPTLLIPASIAVSGLMISKLQYPHMTEALKNPMLRALKIPALVAFLLSITALFGASFWFKLHVIEVFGIFILIYLLHPVYKSRPIHKNT